MKPTYHRCGDYLLPALTIPDESVTLGKYGRMRKTYLKEHKPILYNALLLSGKLTEHLIGVDAECRKRLETLLPQMMRQERVDEALKARDQMEWVRRMNSIQNRAEEILLNELVKPQSRGHAAAFSLPCVAKFSRIWRRASSSMRLARLMLKP